ncbi:MAG: lipocalin-like domain-containing protein [Deltaproteobacteria bacterium]|nr:lipocalin-like domain-containing protein [Deltaproteobacteria bacterium]
MASATRRLAFGATLAFVAALSGCAGAPDRADAGKDASDTAGTDTSDTADTETFDTASDGGPDSSGPDGGPDASADAGACTGEEPLCAGETVVSCVDGSREETPCGKGTFCNYGACEKSQVNLPKDAAPHNFKSEWWYYTGHVADGEQRYGFEVTIFKYNLSVFKGYMCHVAVLDVNAGEHYHTDEIAVAPSKWQSAPIVLAVGSCRFELDGEGHDHIKGTIAKGKEKDKKGAPWIVDLSFDPQKRPALHGDGGFIPMSDSGGTSWYYSYTRMDAVGTIATPDGVRDVAGIGWMDHQWGAFDVMTAFKGWDWWSMQLDDGYEIMLFQFRNWQDVLVTQAGTVMDPKGNQVTFEGLDSFSISSRRTWPSPHTDGVYPLDWDIAIVAGDWALDVLVGVDDQEMYNPAQNYWEGATAISGWRGGTAVVGVGYTELTGYASDLLDPP